MPSEGGLSQPQLEEDGPDRDDERQHEDQMNEGGRRSDDDSARPRPIHIVIIGSGLAALSAAVFLEQAQKQDQQRAQSPCSTAEEDNSSTPSQLQNGPVDESSLSSSQAGGRAGRTAPDRRSRRTQESRSKTTPSSPRWRVTMYERDASWQERRDGYGLTLKYDPNSVLAKLGVLEVICRHDCPSRSHYVLNQEGVVTGYYGNAFVEDDSSNNNSADGVRQGREVGSAKATTRGYGQRGNLRVPRQLVRRALIQRLQSTKIEWGHRLVRLEAVPGDDIDVDRVINECNQRDGHKRANGKCRRTMHRGHTRIRCYFENGASVLADWVLGADGIRSTVVQQHSALLTRYLTNGHYDAAAASIPIAPPLNPLRIRLIVGLSVLDEDSVKHPTVSCLLDERGFYTLGDGTRLFVMPYSAPTPLRPNQSRQYMWQLSFREEPSDACEGAESDVAARQKKRRDPQELLDEAVTICHGWHEPVPLLLRRTPLDTVWSAPLYDRDPHELLQYWESLRRRIRASPSKHGNRPDPVMSSVDRPLPIVVLGDALHAMSCFKGQGAHQALKDGQCVASWIVKCVAHHQCSVESAVNSCHRELVQRTRSVVLDSRQAAHDLHPLTRAGCGRGDVGGAHALIDSSFAGVSDPHRAARLLDMLRSRGVHAGTTAHLDDAIGKVLRELLSASSPRPTTATIDAACRHEPSTSWTHAALDAAKTCNLSELRRLSWNAKDARWMPATVDENGNTLLHLVITSSSPVTSSLLPSAAANSKDATKDPFDVDDRLEAIQWLVREAGCSCRVRNRQGQTPLDLVGSEDAECVALLRVLDDQQHPQEMDAPPSAT